MTNVLLIVNVTNVSNGFNVINVINVTVCNIRHLELNWKMLLMQKNFNILSL